MLDLLGWGLGGWFLRLVFIVEFYLGIFLAFELSFMRIFIVILTQIGKIKIIMGFQ